MARVIHRGLSACALLLIMMVSVEANAQVSPQDVCIQSTPDWRAFRTPAGDYYATWYVPTPHGDPAIGCGNAAYQCGTPDYLSMRDRMLGGQTCYRAGNLGRNPIRGQFWSPMSPASPGYGTAQGINGPWNPSFIVSGTFGPDSRIITRPSPPWGTSPGGAPEVVCRPNAMRCLQTFHYTPDPVNNPLIETGCEDDYTGPGRTFGRPRPRPGGAGGAPTGGGAPAGGGRPGGGFPGGGAGRACGVGNSMLNNGPLVLTGGGLVIDGVQRCAADDPLGVPEATLGTYVVVGGSGLLLTEAGIAGGGTLIAAAPPAAACVAVGTGAYCGTRAVDDACGGRISDCVATAGCATYDTLANICYRWWGSDDGWNYQLTSTSASMFGQGAGGYAPRPVSSQCSGGAVGGVDPPYEPPPDDDGEVDSGGCRVGAAGGASPIALALLVLLAVGIRRRARG